MPHEDVHAPRASEGPLDPLARFRELFARACSAESGDATAFTLATTAPDGRPAARMVLLKDVDPRGFVFYTNLASRKARELSGNPWAALCFYWPSILTQVRAEGRVEAVSDADADAYFASRPRGHQVAAWASRQSAPLASRDALIAACKETEARFGGTPVPRPPFWGGYCLVPDRIEFWHGSENRLHDRVLCQRAGGDWLEQRLYP